MGKVVKLIFAQEPSSPGPAVLVFHPLGFLGELQEVGWMPEVWQIPEGRLEPGFRCSLRSVLVPPR